MSRLPLLLPLSGHPPPGALTARAVLRCCVALALALGAACHGHAADDPAVKREREQLQRARAALREANEQQQMLQAEKAAWSAERQRLMTQQARARSLDAQAERKWTEALQRSNDERLQLDVMLTALRDSAADAARQAADRERVLIEQLTRAQAENADRLALVRAVAALLERSTGALGAAETANNRLHAAGLAAIETFRREIGTQELSVTDPLGWRAVRRENQSDELREALDKPRITAPLAAPRR